MSKKSHPGDGTQGQGVKGGVVYGQGLANPKVIKRNKSVLQAFVQLTNLMRLRDRQDRTNS